MSQVTRTYFAQGAVLHHPALLWVRRCFRWAVALIQCRNSRHYKLTVHFRHINLTQVKVSQDQWPSCVQCLWNSPLCGATYQYWHSTYNWRPQQMYELCHCMLHVSVLWTIMTHKIHDLKKTNFKNFHTQFLLAFFLNHLFYAWWLSAGRKRLECSEKANKIGCDWWSLFPVSLRPNSGHDLLILDVSRSHTTTQHSR